MKKGIVPACIVLLFCHSLLAQQAAPAVTWDSLKFLVGKWVVEVNAEGGQQSSGSAASRPACRGKS